MELEASREGLLPGLLRNAVEKEHIPGGFRWRLDAQQGTVQQAAAVIEAEHRCCPFLRFVLIVEPGDGSLFLEVTGPEGTEDFLSMLDQGVPPQSSHNPSRRI
ncbi:MAG: hypothetical protein ICV75_06765 [Nitrospiraceae bacterium]|nr:hypothetical protein [Nitrospiraceae bacterium]